MLGLPPQQPHCLASSLTLSLVIPVSAPKSASLWRTCDSRPGHFPSTHFLSTLFDFCRARGSEPADPLFSGPPLRWGLSLHSSSLPSRCRVYPRGEGALGTVDMGVHFLLSVPLSCWAGGGVGLQGGSPLCANLWWVWSVQIPGFKHLLLLLWSQNSPFSFHAKLLFCRAVIMLQVTLSGSLPMVIGIFSYHCTLQNWLPWICNISFNGLNYSFT